MRKHSEFEVQAVAYFKLLKEYSQTHSIRGEYRFWSEDGSSCRLDIAILTKNEDEIRLIVTTKRRKSDRPIAKLSRINRQAELTSCPVVVIQGMHQALHAVEIVQQYLKDNSLRL